LAGVTGRPGRINQRHEGVAVAVVADLANVLNVPRARPLAPDLAPAAAVEMDLASLEGELQRLLVHVGEGEHLAGAGVLHHARHEAALIEAHLRCISGGPNCHRAIVRTTRSRA